MATFPSQQPEINSVGSQVVILIYLRLLPHKFKAKKAPDLPGENHQLNFT